MKLLLGTTNPAKISDYKKFLVHPKLELLTLQDIGFIDEPLEIGKTFEENVLQKARFYAERTEYPTLADDGGFEVDVLEGQPGVDSRRWVGPGDSDEDRIQKVFKLMEGVPAGERTARLRNVMVVYFPHERDHIMAEAKIEGIIPNQPSGKRTPGFPYNSVLYIPEHKRYLVEEHEAFNPRRQIGKELLLKLEPYLN